MSNKKFSITCPPTYTNKVAVIKAIRMLTGLGLKEAKDASERSGSQTFDLYPSNFSSYGNPDSMIEEQFRILRSENVQVGEPIHKILQSLRELGSQALQLGEDEFANEILQLVLAEKLRRNP